MYAMEERMDYETSYPQPNFWHTANMATEDVGVTKPPQQDAGITAGMGSYSPQSTVAIRPHREVTGSNVVSTSGVLCAVCSDQAAGRYFGAQICEACKSFFIRSTKKGQPTFRCINSQRCDVTPTSRLLCQYCRYQKCLEAGMCRKAKQPAKEPSPDRLPCKVCGDVSSGIHFGVYTCEGCKGFFRRSLKDGASYTCSGKDPNACVVTPTTRNSCRRCRFHKCLTVGMSRAGIKLGRHQKYLNSPGCEGDNQMSHPESPTHNYPQMNQSSNSYSPGVADIAGNPNTTKDTPNYAGMSGSNYAQMSNYRAGKEFGQPQDYTSCMSGSPVHPGIMNSTVGHVGIPVPEAIPSMNNHGYSVGTPSSLITSPPVSTNSYMYTSKGFMPDAKTSTMDPLSFALNQTLCPPSTNGMLDLLNSPFENYSLPDVQSKSNSYVPQMVNNGINTTTKPVYLTSNASQSYHPLPIKLERAPTECRQLSSPEQSLSPQISRQLSSPEQSLSPQISRQLSSPEHSLSPQISRQLSSPEHSLSLQYPRLNTTSTAPSHNVVTSSTSIHSPMPEEKQHTPCSSCASSPSVFSEYEDDDKETHFDFDPSTTQSIDPNQSIPRPVISDSYESMSAPSSVDSVRTSSGSSFLMGNHWTRHRVEVPEIKQEPVVIIDGDKLVEAKPEVPHIDFELKERPTTTEEEASQSMLENNLKRKAKQMTQPSADWESQMPELSEEYLAKLQHRLKSGCPNGEVLSVESEARLVQIQDPVDDLERGSIMFELSHGFSAFKAQLQQINEQSSGENAAAIKDFKDVFAAKLIACISFVKTIPGFRALSIKDQMILIRFGVFPIHMVNFGTDPIECKWFSIVEKGPLNMVAKGMKNYTFDCLETFKQVKLDRIQIPLLMALLTFNPDLPSLVSRDLILKRHRILRLILRQYCIEKYGNLALFNNIMSLVPVLYQVEYHHKLSVKEGISFASEIALPALFAEINL